MTTATRARLLTGSAAAVLVVTLSTCSSAQDATNSGSPPSVVIQVGSPVGMPEAFSNRPIDSESDGQLNAFGEVSFTQDNGWLYKATKNGDLSRRFQLATDGYVSDLAAGAQDSIAWIEYGTAYMFPRSSSELRTFEPASTSEWWTSIALSPSGRTLALAKDDAVAFWSGGDEIMPLQSTKGAYYSQLYATDSYVIAVNDANLQAWKVPSGTVIPHIAMDIEGGAESWSPAQGDSPLIAIAPRGEPDRDPIRVIDLSTGEVQGQFDATFEPSEYGDFFQDCQSTAISAPGDMVVAGSSAGEIVIWHRKAAAVTRFQLGGADERINHLMIDPTGNLIYAETFLESDGAKIQGHRYLVPVTLTNG